MQDWFIDFFSNRSLNSWCFYGAAAFGMGHAIKVGYHLQNSKEKGKKQKITWSDGTSLDLASQFGSDWIEGSFDSEEIKWLSDINPKANLAQQDGI